MFLSPHCVGSSLKQVARSVRGFARRYVPVDERTRVFIEHNKTLWASWKTTNPESEILVEFYPVSISHIVYSYFANLLARKHNACIKLFSPTHPSSNPHLYAVYQSFNTVGCVVPKPNNDQEALAESLYRRTIQHLKTKEDVFNLRVLDVGIGVEIYETYLRIYNKPTMDLQDPKLYCLIREAIEILLFWQSYLESHKVAAIIISHAIYVNYGILCKLAYANHIPVYMADMIRTLYVDGPFPEARKFRHFHTLFKALPAEEQKKAIAVAKEQLDRRFSGEIGGDIYYTPESPFHRSNHNNAGIRRNNTIKVLIATHCFFDNPHSWGGMLFVDFYEWISYLGNLAPRTEYDWYLKMHPSPVPKTKKVIGELLAKFPHISLVPSDVSHHELVEAGINFVLTCYGTVGHEYPALGVQVINAGYNPHIAYDFNWHAISLKEYESYLLNLEKLDKKINLQDMYEFYYVYYRYFRTHNLYVNDFNQMQANLKRHESIGPEAYTYFLNQFTDARHTNILTTLSRFLESGMRELSIYGPVLGIES